MVGFFQFVNTKKTKMENNDEENISGLSDEYETVLRVLFEVVSKLRDIEKIVMRLDGNSLNKNDLDQNDNCSLEDLFFSCAESLLEDCVESSMKMSSDLLAILINGKLASADQFFPDQEDYEKKKANASYINEYLKIFNMTFYHGSPAIPCTLLAVGSRDGFGRYVLEERQTKKRHGAYKTILDLIPIKLGQLHRRENHRMHWKDFPFDIRKFLR